METKSTGTKKKDQNRRIHSQAPRRGDGPRSQIAAARSGHGQRGNSGGAVCLSLAASEGGVGGRRWEDGSFMVPFPPQRRLSNFPPENLRIGRFVASNLLFRWNFAPRLGDFTAGAWKSPPPARLTFDLEMSDPPSLPFFSADVKNPQESRPEPSGSECRPLTFDPPPPPLLQSAVQGDNVSGY